MDYIALISMLSMQPETSSKPRPFSEIGAAHRQKGMPFVKWRGKGGHPTRAGMEAAGGHIFLWPISAFSWQMWGFLPREFDSPVLIGFPTK
jgi:hypothetical protein